MPRQENLPTIIREGFFSAHAGGSIDALLCDDRRLDAYDRFVSEAARDAGIVVSITEARHFLLNIRKSGKLGPVSRRGPRVNHDSYKHIAETAARITEDRYRITVDRILCDPRMRSDFDAEAGKFSSNASPESIRLAALGLRKAKRLPPLVARRLLPPTTGYHQFALSVERGSAVRLHRDLCFDLHRLRGRGVRARRRPTTRHCSSSTGRSSVGPDACR